MRDVMLRNHEDAVELYERRAGTATDPAVRAFTERTLEVLREHLKPIRAINANMP